MTFDPNDNEFLKNLLKKTTVQDVMNPLPVVIIESAELSDAHELINEHKLSHLLVVNSQNVLAGLITPKYLYKAYSPKKIIGEQTLFGKPDVLVDGDSYYQKGDLNKYVLRSIMWKDPITCAQEDTLADAMIRMDRRRVACVPVVDNVRKVCGILTHQEIINFITKPLMD